jgi:hypothetical protein
MDRWELRLNVDQYCKQILRVIEALVGLTIVVEVEII